MPNLLECLLSGHEDTNKEAVKLYKKAEKLVNARAKKSGDILGGDDFGDEIERLIIENELPKINLLDQGTYERLQQDIGNWYVPFDSEGVSAKCMAVSQVLSSRLDHFRELQRNELPEKCAELLAECKEYKKHLKQLKRTEREKMRVETRKKGMYHVLNPENKKTQQIDQQIDAVRLLITALEDDVTLVERLKNFQTIYNVNKKIIESGHDTAADHFKKVVSSILLLFKGKIKEISSLWKSRGEKLVEKVPGAFKPVKSPYKKI